MAELGNWQKSTYCGEGESCLHVATTTAHVHITESADPDAVILTAAPDTFAALLTHIKQEFPHRD
ncbi:hypothetical protein SALBM135S_08900 [Streptomyces alboniger]